MERKTKRLLKSKIKNQLSAIMELPNRRDILAKIEGALGENPESNKDVRVFSKLIENEAKKKAPNVRAYSVLSMAGFLWKYEGTYMLCVDIFCCILITNGHDLFDPIKRQYVDSIEEISEVDVSTKLKFLERHDFGIINRKQDQKLRNKIAHRDYHFDTFGNVRLGNESIDIVSRHTDFGIFTGEAFIMLCDCIDEYLKLASRAKTHTVSPKSARQQKTN